jgi:UDP-glucose 4-epimerase
VARESAAGVDGIFHLAAVASVSRCNEAWVESHLANATATIAILDAARTGDVPVVYASSAAVYGDGGETAIAETAPLQPLSPYGVDKLAGELHARVGTRIHGLRSIGLRFFNVYGPRQRPDDAYAGVITLFVERIRRGEPLTIYGDGRQSRDFVNVADVVRALDAAMRRLERTGTPTAEVYNVGTGRSVTINELARILMGVLERRVLVSYATPRPGDIRHSEADITRLREALGLHDPIPLAAGLAEMLGSAAVIPPMQGRCRDAS